MVQETNRFTKHEKCERCGFKYGFHICINRDEKTMQKEEPVTVKREPVFRGGNRFDGVFTDEMREKLSEASKRRWDAHREKFKERDEKIVKRYAEGDISMLDLAKQFGMGRQRVNQILQAAAAEGRVTINGKGKRLSDTKKSEEKARRNAQIVEEYKKGGVSTIDIGEVFGMSSQHVLKILQEAQARGEVTIRPRGRTLAKGAV